METKIQRPLDYIPLPVVIRGELASSFSLKDIGTAVLLSLYCGEQVNGGLIKNARSWSKTDWMLRVHLNKKLTEDCAGLWHWEGEHLRVELYDAEQEKRVLSKRKQTSAAGKRGMGNRWGNVTDDITDVITDDITDAVTSKVKEREDKEKEREREEGAGEGIYPVAGGAVPIPPVAAAAASPSSPSPSSPPPSFPAVPLPFNDWLKRICGAVPALGICRELHGDVIEAARAAYKAMPDSLQYAELLTAYYASKRAEDSRGKEYWRPTGVRFFEELNDVIFRHAERWDRDTGWSKKRRREEREKAEARRREEKEQGESGEDILNADEIVAMWRGDDADDGNDGGADMARSAAAQIAEAKKIS